MIWKRPVVKSCAAATMPSILLFRLNLTEPQKNQLIAFLESLTSANAEALAKQARAPFNDH